MQAWVLFLSKKFLFVKTAGKNFMNSMLKGMSNMTWSKYKVGTPICYTEWRYVFDGEDFEKRLAILAKIVSNLDDNVNRLYIAEKHRRMKEADEDMGKAQPSMKSDMCIICKSNLKL